MNKQVLSTSVSQIASKIAGEKVIATVTIPVHPSHGDFTTNVALILAKNLKQNPMMIANEIKARCEAQNSSEIARIEVVKPGFINFFVSETSLLDLLPKILSEGSKFGARVLPLTSPMSHFKLTASAVQTSEAQHGAPRFVSPAHKKPLILVEFAHPNTHKLFHIGHLRNITTGEAVARLLESQGIEVKRVNYQGDVGMHIAKALYALLEIPNLKSQIPKVKGINERVALLGDAYATGSKAFEESPEAKLEIIEINKKIYAQDQKVWNLYEMTRQWSLDYFKTIYDRVGTKFDRLYFESEVYQKGKEIVQEHIKNGVFEESDGAVIFPGEKFGLHNRVFITKEGNATYEGKEMGLAQLQHDEYHPDLIIHVVASEQTGYFQVVFKAIEQLFPDLNGKEFHLIYGFVQLKQGKMSSRSGNVVLGEWLLDEAGKYVNDLLLKNKSNYSKIEQKEIVDTVSLAAVKYSFLKSGVKTEIAFDFKESVNLEGDSGPYLLYTYARCQSVLKKSKLLAVSFELLGKEKTNKNLSKSYQLKATSSNVLNPEERAVLRLLGNFPEIVVDAASNYAPNTLCTYLFELAQAFNLFYGKHSILGDTQKAKSEKQESEEKEDLSLIAYRLSLTSAVAQVLKNGLNLLGINTVEKM